MRAHTCMCYDSLFERTEPKPKLSQIAERSRKYASKLSQTAERCRKHGCEHAFSYILVERIEAAPNCRTLWETWMHTCMLFPIYILWSSESKLPQIAERSRKHGCTHACIFLYISYGRANRSCPKLQNALGNMDAHMHAFSYIYPTVERIEAAPNCRTLSETWMHTCMHFPIYILRSSESKLPQIAERSRKHGCTHACIFLYISYGRANRSCPKLQNALGNMDAHMHAFSYIYPTVERIEAAPNPGHRLLILINRFLLLQKHLI